MSTKSKPLCRICGRNVVTRKEKGKDRTTCWTCTRRPWVRNKGNRCEQCGFIALHRCQLDVHHIDGNRKNNKPENHQTLCANCHRLVTWIERVDRVQ